LQVGRVYVFVRNGGTWSQQAVFEGDDSCENQTFGWSVSLDGDTLAVGGPYGHHPGGTLGRVFVFQRSGSTWSLQEEIFDSVGTGRQFGRSVSIEGDTLLVGDPFQGDGQPGAAAVFLRSGGTWTELQELGPSDPTLNPSLGLDQLGESVSLDGSTFV